MLEAGVGSLHFGNVKIQSGFVLSEEVIRRLKHLMFLRSWEAVLFEESAWGVNSCSLSR
jgi:hypothetical protein